jgi:RimJ/RimL family protein N-acetyltransferase
VAVADADFAEKPTLPGERVTLVPLTAEHFPAVWQGLQDRDVLRFTGSQGSVTQQGLLDWMSTRAGTTDRLDLAIIDNACGDCVGEVVLNEWDEPNRSCSFRIMVVAAGQNRGLGTEATRLVLRHGFEVLGLHRIHLGVFAFNPRARRAYEKVGFVPEGVRRDALLWDGTWYDSIEMSILENEWRIHRGFPGSRDGGDGAG